MQTIWWWNVFILNITPATSYWWYVDLWPMVMCCTNLMCWPHCNCGNMQAKLTISMQVIYQAIIHWNLITIYDTELMAWVRNSQIYLYNAYKFGNNLIFSIASCTHLSVRPCFTWMDAISPNLIKRMKQKKRNIITIGLNIENYDFLYLNTIITKVLQHFNLKTKRFDV